ncbi:MAG TPA: 3-deoxy-8-phosphooctulonate synthase [Gammaproteobacteria bacterium]|nr:3-deoxy-8-phosphooctulonate synthase [Gammaproteobacteria bacterium]HIG50562.1 3-deoxy-8-phosphooctulonate synthase [Gammaproteobacteria bacterium]
MKTVKVGEISLSNKSNLVLISGLNVLEDKFIVKEVVGELKKVSDELDIPFIFKASYDKANRSSIESFRGPGIENGLEVLRKIKSDYKVPVMSDVHSPGEVKKAKEILDVLQIPAFLCRQTDLISSAAITGLPINVKKGQFLSPAEMKNIITKFEHFNNKNILLCERGTTFGYNNLVVDMLGLAELKRYDYPVIFDVTHSLQEPGGEGESTSGRRSLALDLAKSAISIGIAGLFLETHPDPDKAKCDGPCALPLKHLKEFLYQIKAIDKLVKTFSEIEIS